LIFFEVHSIFEAINRVTERFAAADVMKLAARSLSPRRVTVIDTKLITVPTMSMAMGAIIIFLFFHRP
jgi:hypothetical protein